MADSKDEKVVSRLNKVLDLTVELRQFTNNDTGEIIEYTRLVCHIELNGEPEVVEFKSAEGTAAYKLLKAASVVE